MDISNQTIEQTYSPKSGKISYEPLLVSEFNGITFVILPHPIIPRIVSPQTIFSCDAITLSLQRLMKSSRPA